MSDFGTESLVSPYWYTMPYPDIKQDYNNLRAYEVVTEVPTLSAFNIVEQAICARLRPQGRDGENLEAIATYEGAIIVRNPVENRLRPKGFNGQLLDGQALILPFDSDMAVSHNVSLENSKALDSIVEGFSVLYLGRLKAAQVGMLGGLMLEATYRTSLARPHNTMHHLVKRTLGRPQMEREDIEALLEARGQASSAAWRRAKTYALKHLYYGGLPGTKQ